MAGKKVSKGKAKKVESERPSPPGPLVSEASPAEPEAPPHRTVPPVAGIGASAGGLDAFKKFFAAMPPDSGVAFVLIPHLDPRHESMMVELLARQTAMPVVEAAQGMCVEANRVYILPPNKYMTIGGGKLHLTGPVDRSNPQTSIDIFLRSLADDLQERAICIIMSGTGSHGTLGLRAVKAAGGIAMVQDPSTADYDRMPKSAVETGLADYILPPDKMPEALVGYLKHFYLSGGLTVPEKAEAPDYLDQVLTILHTRGKLDFRNYRKKMLSRRIERRMSLTHLERPDEYVKFLREHADEVKNLARDLLISVTSFFRDPEAFKMLSGATLAPLLEARSADDPLRIWSVGCATGEEPYSIGILALEQMTALGLHCPMQIFATDIDEDALDVARRAVYPESISADVTPERLGRFFVRHDDSSYRVGKNLREALVFARQNVLSDAPFSKPDLIVCRNLMIYLEPEAQRKLIALFHFALKEKGFLFLGPSETIGRHSDMFETLDKKWRIFRRIGPVRPERVEFPTSTARPVVRAPAPTPARPGRAVSYADRTRQFLLDLFCPAAVLINAKYEVLYSQGPVDRYLAMAIGEPSHDLLSLAREGLQSKLRPAIHKVQRELVETALTARIKRNGGMYDIQVSIRPLPGAQSEEHLLLLTFADMRSQTEPAPPPPESASQESAVQQLEQELKATREELQGTIEEMESSNEELKASNEEIMSMNEELQSANEELETSKEELQSLNEEVTTVNNQLHEKVSELESANSDIANLFHCTEVAAIFLDEQFRVRRFTPASGQMVSLIEADVGRPLRDIALKFTDPDLLSDAAQVLRQLTPSEREVATEDGRWCVRRIVPYRTLDNHISGVAVTFSDVTQYKKSEQILKEGEANLRRLVNVLDVAHVFAHDVEGRILHWSAGSERVYQCSRQEAVGQNFEQLLQPEFPLPRAEIVRRALEAGSWRGEILYHRRDGTPIPVISLWSAVKDEEGKLQAILQSNNDISELKEAEHRQRLDLEAMSWLRQVGEVFALQADLEPVLRVIIEAAIAISQADFGHIQLTDKKTGELHIAAQIGFPSWWVDYWNGPGQGHESCDEAKKLNERTIIEDVEKSPIFAGTPGLEVQLRAGVRAYQSTPLLTRSGTVLGMFSTHYKTPHRPDERTLRLLDLLSRLAADIIERTRTDLELRIKEAQLQLITDNTPVLLVRVNRELRYTFVNRAAARFLGRPPEQIVGKPIDEIVGPDAVEAIRPYFTRVLQGERVEFETEISYLAAGRRFMRVTYVPERDLHGNVAGWFSSLLDITEEKKAEQLLKEFNAELEKQVKERTFQLSERESRLHAILNSAFSAIITIDKNGIIESANPAAEKMLGYTVAEMVGHNVGMLMPSPHREQHDHHLERYARTGEAHVLNTTRETQAVRKDGTLLDVAISVGKVDHLGLFIGIMLDVTHRKELEREVVEIAVLEQQRIGQDLHDDIGQELTGLGLLTNTLAECLTKASSEHAALAEKIGNAIRRTLLKVRTLSRGLAMAEVKPEELPAALAELTSRLAETSGVRCVCETGADAVIADALQATHLYHIAQEACTNAIKHGNAQNLEVSLQVADHVLTLQIRDDGVGIGAEPEGLGCKIMRNRANVLGASLAIESTQPQGTVVRCTLNLEQSNDDH